MQGQSAQEQQQKKKLEGEKQVSDRISWLEQTELQCYRRHTRKRGSHKSSHTSEAQEGQPLYY